MDRSCYGEGQGLVKKVAKNQFSFMKLNIFKQHLQYD